MILQFFPGVGPGVPSIFDRVFRAAQADAEGALAPEDMQAPEQRGILSKLGDIFAGQSEGATRRQALMNAGLAIAAAGGQTGLDRQSLTSALVQGAQVGQATAAGAASRAQLEAVMGENPAVALPQLRAMFAQATLAGDNEAARNIATVIQSMEASAGGSQRNLVFREIAGELIGMDPATGAIVSRHKAGDPPLRTLDTGGEIIVYSGGDPRNVVDRIPKSLSPNAPMQMERDDARNTLAVFDRVESALEPVRLAASAFSRIQGAAAAGSGADDIVILTDFMKMIDSGSVVRPSEIALAREVASWRGKAAVALERLKAGTDVLPAESRQEFVNAARRFAALAARNGQDIIRRHQAIARETGAQIPAEIWEDPFGGLDMRTPEPSKPESAVDKLQREWNQGPHRRDR